MRHSRHKSSARPAPTIAQRRGGEDGHGEGLIFGIHAVEAAIANPRRTIAKLFLTENCGSGFDGGGGWIRTSVGEANGFTVRPL